MYEYALSMLVALPGNTPKYSEDIAKAIAEVSNDDRLLAAEIAAIGFYESGYLPRIQAGECQKHECDKGRARSWWQFQQTSYSRDSWDNSVGLKYDAILTSSKVVANILLAGRKNCHSIEGTMAYYARGYCTWSGAKYRANMVRKLMAVR